MVTGKITNGVQNKFEELIEKGSEKNEMSSMWW